MTGNNFLAPIQNKLPQEFRDMAAYPVQQADRIYNVDYASEINATCNFYALHQAEFSTKPMDVSHYNLFVIDKRDKMISSPFFMSSDVILQNGTTKEVKESFFSMDAKILERITLFPSIFTTVNSGQGTTDEGHRALYGRVEKIERQEHGYLIHWGCMRIWSTSNSVPFISQMELINHAGSFGLGVAPCSNELDDVHWAIKKLNVIEALSEIGIDAMVI